MSMRRGRRSAMDPWKSRPMATSAAAVESAAMTTSRRTLDPYAVLGVPRDATPLQVARAHRQPGQAPPPRPPRRPQREVAAAEMRHINDAWASSRTRSVVPNTTAATLPAEGRWRGTGRHPARRFGQLRRHRPERGQRGVPVPRTRGLRHRRSVSRGRCRSREPAGRHAQRPHRRRSGTPGGPPSSWGR